jgi:hypothetical protein
MGSENFFGSHHLFLLGWKLRKSQKRRCFRVRAEEGQKILIGAPHKRNRCKQSEVQDSPVLAMGVREVNEWLRCEGFRCLNRSQC